MIILRLKKLTELGDSSALTRRIIDTKHALDEELQKCREIKITLGKQTDDECSSTEESDSDDFLEVEEKEGFLFICILTDSICIFHFRLWTRIYKWIGNIEKFPPIPWWFQRQAWAEWPLPWTSRLAWTWWRRDAHRQEGHQLPSQIGHGTGPEILGPKGRAAGWTHPSTWWKGVADSKQVILKGIFYSVLFSFLWRHRGPNGECRVLCSPADHICQRNAGHWAPMPGTTSKREAMPTNGALPLRPSWPHCGEGRPGISPLWTEVTHCLWLH